MISVTKTTMYATGWILWLKARLGILSKANYGRVIMYHQEYHYSFAEKILKTFFKHQELNDYIAWAMVECSQEEIARMYLKWAKENGADIPKYLFRHLIKDQNLSLLKEFIKEIPLTVQQERILIRMVYRYGDTFGDILKFYLSVSPGQVLTSCLNVKLMEYLDEKYSCLVKHS